MTSLVQRKMTCRSNGLSTSFLCHCTLSLLRAGETVRSIECGVVCTPDYPEVIVASYSGKVISFTTEPILARAADDNYGMCVCFFLSAEK